MSNLMPTLNTKIPKFMTAVNYSNLTFLCQITGFSKMFKRASTIPQRNKFSLTKDQIIEDIEAIRSSEEQRQKLYYCIDDKPPTEHRFEKIEEFLKGTQDLEKNAIVLTGLKNDMEKLQREICYTITALKAAGTNITLK